MNQFQLKLYVELLAIASTSFYQNIHLTYQYKTQQILTQIENEFHKKEIIKCHTLLSTKQKLER